MAVAPEPSFISQYGPLLAALVALAGALLTLYVSGRRSLRDSILRREDEYRKVTREAVARALSEARRFQTEAWAMSNPFFFIGLGYEGAFRLRDETNSAMLALGQALISVRLLALDEALRVPVDSLMDRFESVDAVVHEASDAFWEERPPTAIWTERDQRFRAFAEACAVLQSEATTVLAPTVRDRQGLRRGRRPRSRTHP